MNKNNYISFRCTEEQKKQLLQQANNAGLTLSQFILSRLNLEQSSTEYQNEVSKQLDYIKLQIFRLEDTSEKIDKICEALHINTTE